MPFRGENGLTDSILGAGLSFEGCYGNFLNHDRDETVEVLSPIAVRFQGARIAGGLVDLCEVGVAAPIVPGSVTAWVDHPAKLNPDPLDADFIWPEPNVIRYAVIFDTSMADAPTVGSCPIDLSTLVASIRGVTNLWMRADPE